MNINIVNTTGAQYNADQNVLKSKEKLGKEDFLRLLVTQLRYQDPTQPMSNEQFISQTAQFSSLEQMQTMNSNLQTFIDSQGKVGKTSALSLVGKNVVIDKSAFSLSSDTESASLNYNLTAEATATLTVYDSSNKAIKSINLGKQSAGTHSYLWDGKTNETISAGKGEYSYKISAKGVNGNDISTDEMVSGLIDGISFEGNETFLNIAGSSFPLSSLVKVLPSSTGG